MRYLITMTALTDSPSSGIVFYSPLLKQAMEMDPTERPSMSSLLTTKIEGRKRNGHERENDALTTI
jgi:hypothetical protein